MPRITRPGPTTSRIFLPVNSNSTNCHVHHIDAGNGSGDIGVVVDLLGGDLMELLKFYTSPVKTFWAGVPEDYQLMAGVGLVVMTLI